MVDYICYIGFPRHFQCYTAIFGGNYELLLKYDL